MVTTPHQKYQRILESIEDIADATKGKLILVGGTALAIFYLNHRASQDLDFMPLKGDDAKMKEWFKGQLSKKGFKTLRSTYTNMFVVQFDDTSIKVELFFPTPKPAKIEKMPVGRTTMLVASLDDLLTMKTHAYRERKEARDLYDVVSIHIKIGKPLDEILQLIREVGPPKNVEELRELVTNETYGKAFEEVLKHVA